MNAQKKKLDPVTWIGVFVFAAVAVMIAMLLYEAISGRDEYEAEQRAEQASTPTAAGPAAASPASAALSSSVSPASSASGN
ncbi:hypothetical protein [Pararobbsia alpina]|uniref:Uncharacterized protein n=1 Tax=Pararobbsia alpina TaxID=621374 RepID=A0A6S7B2A9_9BURK|nr:hypothetical protein [Pararobbsia alpina]CAB3784815.1 hypothetical protein LMG28138_01884 [Pararobbsia alpina]